MKKIEVNKDTIKTALCEFLGDIGYRNCKSFAGLKKFLRRRRWKLKTEETKDLIYFTIIDKKTNKPKYYSWPIIKFEHEYDKENKIFIKIENSDNIIDIHESDIPVYDYNKMREKLKPKQEEIRKHKEWKKEFIQRRKKHTLDKCDFIYDIKDKISNEIAQKLNLSETNYILYKNSSFYCLTKKRDKRTHKLKYFYKTFKTILPNKNIILQVKKSDYYKWGEFDDYLIIYSSSQLSRRHQEPRYIEILVPENLSQKVKVLLTYYNDPSKIVDEFLKTGIIDMKVICEKYKPRDITGSRLAVSEIEWDLSHLKIIEAKPEGTDRLSGNGSMYTILQNDNIEEIKENIIYAIESYMLRW